MVFKYELRAERQVKTHGRYLGEQEQMIKKNANDSFAQYLKLMVRNV